MATVILGTQWGDEGKGKMVDVLAKEKKFKAIVRYQGGNNAGHTVVVKNKRHAFHLLPSGILYPEKTCVIANGVIINPKILLGEIKLLESQLGKKHARLLISPKTHLIMPWHQIRDGIMGGKIGTTGRGIGPTYSDYVARRGIRVMDLMNKKRFQKRVEQELKWNKKLIKLMLDFNKVSSSARKKFSLGKSLNKHKIITDYCRWFKQLIKNPLISVADVSLFLSQQQKQGNDILFEGAQATLLDISHGTYPFVTSSNPTIGGLYIGTGFRPRKLKSIGVVKAYTTRVGAGPFPTELLGKTGRQLRQAGNEFGTTTGRPRRCGWLDLTIIKYAQMINGLNSLAITKLDILTGINPLKIAIAYQIKGKKTTIFNPDIEALKKVKVIYKKMAGWQKDISQIKKFSQLPSAAKKYLDMIEQIAGAPIEYISVGPNRSQIIKKK